MKLIAFLAVFCAVAVTAPATANPVQLVLRLHERISMDTLVDNVLNPNSPRYHKYYTPQEIRQIAGPTDADYANLLSALQDRGFTVVKESPTHLFVTVKGEASVASQLFAVKWIGLSDTLHTFSGRIRVPNALNLIASVTGLDNRRHSFPKHIVRQPEDGGASMGVSIATIRTLYGLDPLYSQGLSGAGQDLAIATYDDFDASIPTEYYSMMNISPVPTVDKVAVNGTPKTNDNSAMETVTDIELSGSIAPGAKIHVFSSATNDDAGELALFTAILDDNRAKVANYSWGGCEKDLTAQHKSDMDAVFKRAVAQGVNIMVASGDSGSACAEADASGNVTNYIDPMADWPAAHPAVVAVGGVTLDTSESTQLSETAWTGNGSAGGSGGGISTIWDLPSWQQQLGGQYTRRSYPDVAFNADPKSGQEVVISEFGIPLPTIIGGTSIAAPQWAGFMLLVGEARAKANRGPVGFIDPILYGMSAADRAQAFDDVTSGNNGKYTAGPGWDAVTGWGGMHASALLSYLVKQ